MINTDHFQELEYDNINRIFRGAGDMGKLALVSHFFNVLAERYAEETRRQVLNTFGEFSLNYVFRILRIEDKSNIAKIDRLFRAGYRLSERNHLDDFCYKGIALDNLNQYMSFVREARSLWIFWEALLKIAPQSLKKLMSQVPFEDDLSDNAGLIKLFLERHKGELSNIKFLDLSSSALRVLPTQIRYFSGLIVLELRQNLLVDLPEEIGRLPSLTYLNCRSNYLEFIPDEICRLKKLVTLNLSCNRLKVLPEKIGDLQSLESLLVEKNLLSSIPPSINSLQRLRELYLHDNYIQSLPLTLSGMKNLIHLALQNNRLLSLPEEIGKLVSLQSLILEGNKIKQIPGSLCFLSNLSHLFISNNEISELPNSFGALKNLQFFCYTGNPIEKFPLDSKKLPFWSIDPNIYPYLQEDGSIENSLDAALSTREFLETYWGLGGSKWQECIDGMDHQFGIDVYDKGLHGGKVEFGFIPSMFQAFHFLADHPNCKIDPVFYLKIHKHACRHFNGEATSTTIGQEKVGVFRDYEDAVAAGFSEPEYFMNDQAIHEFESLNKVISKLFGDCFGLGEIKWISKSPRSIDIHYLRMSKEQIGTLFNFFLTEFYYDIGHAKNRYLKINAIAKLIQRLEWLHPVKDGCGRTDTALLNYLLTSYGENPVLLNFPYVSSCKGLNDWTTAVLNGIEDWKQRRDEIQAQEG